MCIYNMRKKDKKKKEKESTVIYAHQTAERKPLCASIQGEKRKEKKAK